MITFENTAFKVLQNMHFQLKAIKFVLDSIPYFIEYISVIKTKNALP